MIIIMDAIFLKGLFYITILVTIVHILEASKFKTPGFQFWISMNTKTNATDKKSDLN